MDKYDADSLSDVLKALRKKQKRTIIMDETRFLEEDFSSYVDEIVRSGSLDGPAEGIARQVIDRGVDSLSEKQKHVFMTHVIDPNYVEECIACSNDIPWCEMNHAVDNGGSCSWCYHRDTKDD